jgi:hypothetical protein
VDHPLVDAIRFAANVGPVLLANVLIDLDREAAALSPLAPIESIGTSTRYMKELAPAHVPPLAAAKF